MGIVEERRGTAITDQAIFGSELIILRIADEARQIEICAQLGDELMIRHRRKPVSKIGKIGGVTTDHPAACPTDR